MIKQLILHYEIETLIITGDFFHGVLSDKTLQQMIFKNIFELPIKICHLVLGNHDKDFPEQNCMVIHNTFEMEHILFTHEPSQDEQFNICGHIHPVVKLRAFKETFRLKCFWLESKRLILPAFGEFTGGFEIFNSQKGIIYAIAGNKIQKI